MKFRALPLVVAALAASSLSHAEEYEITITNLTQGIHFTPLLVAAHSDSASLFAAGETASTNLQAMAEGGDISGLMDDLTAVSATMVGNPAGGLLGPAASTTTTVNTDGSPDNQYLSIVAMMLPTNDAFVGLNSAMLPTEVGTSMSYDLAAYDAGTEANDEMRGSGAPGEAGFPVPPGSPVDTGSLAAGSGGSGIVNSAEGFIHIHRNVLGDTDANAGSSDIDSRIHRWLNPVARVTVTLVSM